MAEEEVDLDLGEEKKGGGNKLFIIIIAVLSLALIGLGVFVFLSGGDSGVATDEAATEQAAAGETPGGAAEAAPVPIYHPLDEAMIINLISARHPRYLQLKMQFLVYSPEASANIDMHLPVIRNNIQQTLANIQYEDLMVEGSRQMVRQKILDEVRATMEKLTGKPGVEDVFFDSFVIQ